MMTLMIDLQKDLLLKHQLKKKINKNKMVWQNVSIQSKMYFLKRRTQIMKTKSSIRSINQRRVLYQRDSKR